MIFDQESNSLLNSKHKLVKTFDCPLSKKWEMMSITESESVRFCGACQKDVIDITPFGESQIIALFQVNPSACAHINFHKALCEFEFINSPLELERCNDENSDNLPIINTARDLTAINRAVKEGFTVIIEPTNPNNSPESKVCLTKDKNGFYKAEGFDYRSGDWMDSQTTYLKSSKNLSPFAAYIIPRNFPANKRVFVPDVIEHLISSSWNQGDEYRLDSSNAIWDGERIIIDEPQVIEMVG